MAPRKSYPRRKKPHGSGGEFPKMVYHPVTGDGTVVRDRDAQEQSGYVEYDELSVPFSGATTKHPLPVEGRPAQKSKADSPNKGAAAELGFKTKAEVTELLKEMEIKFDGRKSADDLAAEHRAAIEAYLTDDEDESDEDGSDEDESDEDDEDDESPAE